jgi:hypothetical protein
MVPGVGAVAASATVHPKPGVIEICKSGDNGMSGKTFSFSLNGGNAISVKGGSCSGPIATGWGVNTVVEAPTSGLAVVSIASNHLVDEDLASRTAHVRVLKGSTAATETVVTYTNAPKKVLGLKVCKAADPALVGDPFSFTENGGPAFSVDAGTAAAPNCSAIKKFQLGTVVHVHENAVPNVAVGSISVSDNRGSNVNLANGNVDVTIGSGVTIVTYTNTVVPPTQFGYVEVCKTRGDHYVSGSFNYTITAPGFTTTRSVPVGNCSDAIRVPAGNVSIAETARAPYYVEGINVSPAGRVVSRNLANGSVVVSVPVGDPSTETLVKFRNATATSQIKVCKTLTSNSSALTGRVFSFTVSDANGQHIDRVVAGPPGTTNCKLDNSRLPVGSLVSITEKAAPNVQVVGVNVAPASQDAGSSGSTARLVVGSGTLTIATFTNEAYGTIEVCKIAADPSTATQTFQFSVNGAPAISVPANQCSKPLSVPAGTATVAESGPANFHLVSVVAKGPDGASRLLTGSTANPATVSVPYGGVENETVAEFTNAVNTGEFKICKVSSEPTLQNTAFAFTYSYTLPGAGEATQGTASLKPGQCSALSGDIPVVDPQGNSIPVYITEAPTPSVKVSNVSVDNGTLVAADYNAGTATIYVRRGFTTVTYTNVRTPIGDGNRVF